MYQLILILGSYSSYTNNENGVNTLHDSHIEGQIFDGEDHILIIQGHLHHTRDLQQALKFHSHLQQSNSRFAAENWQQSHVYPHFLELFMAPKLWSSENTFTYLGVCGFIFFFKKQVLYICFLARQSLPLQKWEMIELGN